MKLKLAVFTALLALGACAQTTGLRVDPEGARRAAESPPELVAVADAMQARRGSRIGADLTLTDARAEGDVLALDLAHDASAAEFTAASRDALVADFDRDFGAQLCAHPALASFVQSRGGVRATIETADGAPLASRTITRCG